MVEREEPLGEPLDELPEKPGGMGSFLATIRLIFNNPITRAYLKAASKRVECIEDGKKWNAPIIFHSLAAFAGIRVTGCPVTARFLSWMLRTTIKLAMKALKGNVDEVKDAFKDPALRRAVSVVLEGLGKYGVTVPQKMPAPFLIVWNFTNMCNLRCMHCYQRADKPSPDELTLEEKLMVVDQLDKAGVAMVALSGGEPTIHPHFYRIVKELADRGIYVSVATNGTTFAKKENLEKAVKLGLRYVEVSVDSAKPEVHDKFRGVPGAWEKAVQALRNAVEMGVNNGMATTVTKLNVHEIPDIIDLAEEIGVRRLILFNFVPVGRGAENAWLDLSPEEREELFRMVYKEMRKRKLEIVSTAPQYGRIVLQMSGGKEISPTHFYVGHNQIVKAVAEFVGGCGAGRIYAGLQPNGDVIPCVFLPIKVGNIREKPFSEIWETAPLFQQLRNRELLKGFCGKCPYKYICGGCRARAYAYFGDPLAPDPGCIYNKAEWEKIASKYKIRLKSPPK
jgi:radical SAM protein with 4Fe4S-binding SPASM domain